jgi:hypothetical protein
MPPNFGKPLYFGRVFGSYITDLPVGEYARIDFVHLGKCVATSSSIINVPGEAGSNIHIRNDGPCTVQYSVNSTTIQEMIGGFIAVNMSRELKWPEAVVKSVNLFCIATGNSMFANVAVEMQK